MRNILALARITFLEGIRSRSVFGIALFSFFVLGLNITVAGFFMRDIGKVTVDMNISALNFAGILLLFFVGLNLITKDIEKRTIQIVLSKPISRLEYVLGKYFGIISFTFVSFLVLVLVSTFTIFFLKKFYSEYFFDYLWANYYISCFFIYVKFSLLASVIILFSSVATSSFVSLIFSLSVFIVGLTIEDVVFYLKSEIAIQEKVVSAGLERFISFISYICPNFSAFDFGMEASHGLMIEPERMLFVLLYAVVYISILLFLSAYIFSRREFY